MQNRRRAAARRRRIARPSGCPPGAAARRTASSVCRISPEPMSRRRARLQRTRRESRAGSRMPDGAASVLVDFLSDPKTRLSSLIQSDTKQCRFGFQEACNGESLAAYAQRKNLRLAHRAEIRLAHLQGALLIAI